MKSLVAVTIPIYKEKIDQKEIIALKQCIKTLKQHVIIFFAPLSLNLTNYKKMCENEIDFKVVLFEDHYFENIAGYNNLMLSTHFYKNFLDYKFILIYQLDAFVFKDELLYWCQQNYDFIGAPNTPFKNIKGEFQFLKNYNRFLNFLNKVFKINHQISNVGNGGFSLRKTRSCYLLLKLLKNKAHTWNNNEDAFFRYWGNLLHPLFRLSTDKKALKFSIETSPKESLRSLNNILPFGCHAFDKYDWETWKPYIPNK